MISRYLKVGPDVSSITHRLAMASVTIKILAGNAMKAFAPCYLIKRCTSSGQSNVRLRRFRIPDDTDGLVF
jgi:hypothetical protein